MPPLVIIAVPCETQPCNVSDTVVRLMGSMNDTAGGAQEEYDSEGAARFIIATVLVYSLMGVLGMLFLRIKRSASRTRRSTSTREESAIKYIKKTDRLMLEARRDIMKREAARTSERLKIVRQGSEDSSASTNPCEFSLSDSLNLTASFNGSHLCMPQSPTSTSMSLLMPLLPAAQQPSPQGTDNTQSSMPKVVFHFPTLPHLTLPQTIISSPSPSSAVSATPTSTPGTRVKQFDNVPKSDPVVKNEVGPSFSKVTTDCNMNDTNDNATISCTAGIRESNENIAEICDRQDKA